MIWEDARDAWEPLGGAGGGSLREARLQAHWAVQPIAAFGIHCVPRQPDHGHACMTWLQGPRLLAGMATEAGIRLALRIESLTLALLDGSGEVRRELPMFARTLEDEERWIVAATGRERPDTGATEEPPGYEIPPHPVSSGAAFGGVDPEALAELGRWYADAARIVSIFARENPDASPVRCWPYRLEISTQILFDPDEPDLRKARSIEIGMLPGDAWYDEPYFYVNPWPRPELVQPPALEGDGLWHLQGWLGAVLPASRFPSGETPREQAERVRAFIHSALIASRALLNV